MIHRGHLGGAKKYTEEKKEKTKGSLIGIWFYLQGQNLKNKSPIPKDEISRIHLKMIDGKTGEEIIDIFNSKSYLN